MNSADQTPIAKLAVSHSAKPPQVKAKDMAKWLDKWQAAWDKLGRGSD